MLEQSSAPTSVQRLARAVRELEGRVTAVAETALQGLIVHRRFKPLFANQAYALMHGLLRAEEVIERGSILEFMDEAAQHAPDAAWTALLAGKPVSGRRTLHRLDGEPYRAEMFARAILWDGEPAVAMALIDVTREERTLQALREAHIAAETATRAKNQFLAAASHELRTPLHAAMGRLALLCAETMSAQGRILAEQALGSCRKLLRLIEDVLDLSAIEHGRIDTAAEAFEVKAALETALEEAQEHASGAGVRLSLRYDGAGMAIGDERRLIRIAATMIEEALRRGAAGALTLQAEFDASGLTLNVAAPGGAGDPHEQAWVIELAAARAIAAALGGVLVERATAEGWEASTFLPLAQRTEAAPRTSLSEARALNILVVEDNPGNRQMMGLVLKALGHRARLAESGQAALALLAEQPFDLILMDLSMPGMDGFETARRIRALPKPWSKAPIAAVTASCAAGVREAIAEAGMDAYLTKPVDLARLAGAIALLSREGSIEAAKLDQVEGEDQQDEPGDESESGHDWALMHGVGAGSKIARAV